jgi:CheY-like chemotaxis protein
LHTNRGMVGLTGTTKRKKILLVDDSLTVLRVQGAMLGGRNYELLFAQNGKEAVETAVAERPDLILMDLIMPVMDGVQAVRQLRAQEATRSTPIILVTGRGDSTELRLGYEAGCNGHLDKPFHGSEVLEKLQTYLGE